MKKKVLLICCILCFANILAGQNTKVVKGEVIDTRSNQPLSGALLIHPPSKVGGASGRDGSFRIEISDSIDYLVISYLGYFPQKLYLNCDSCEYKVYLIEDMLTMEEAIIYAYNVDKHPYSSLQSIQPTIFNTADGTSISNILNIVPGVFMQSGSLNTNRISVRGIGARSAFSTRNIKTYYNDIPIISGDGESLIEDFDLNTLDNITVLKGPSGSTFGAPLGGAILLNNGHFGNSNFTSDFSLGSYGLWRTTNRLKLHESKLLFQFYQSKIHSAGYRDNNHYSRETIGFNGQYQMNKHTFSFIGNNINLTSEIPSSIDSVTYVNNPSAAAPTWAATNGNEDYGMAVFGINHKYVNQLESGLKMSISNSLFASLKNHAEIRPFNILDEKFRNGGWRSLMKVGKTFENWSFDYSIGTELFFEKYEWQTYENENNGTQGELLMDILERRAFVNIFNELEWKRNNFSIVAGLNVNNTSYLVKNENILDTITQSGTHDYGWTTSPKIGVSYNFKTYYLADLSIYSNLSHGFSMPSADETLQPNGIINTNLKPELGWNFEIGTRGNLFDGRILYDFTIYQMKIKNLIVTERISEDQTIGINAGKTLHEGFELSFKYVQPFFISQELVFSSSYTSNNFTFTEFINDGNDYSGNVLTGVPKDVCNMQIDWDGKEQLPFFATISSIIVDEIAMNDANTKFSEEYWLINFKAGYQKRYRKMKMNMHLGINNLFNEKYASMIGINASSFGGNAPRYYYPGLPRNYYFGMKVSVDF
jgi:iron complex outermembrane receptor protein